MSFLLLTMDIDGDFSLVIVAKSTKQPTKIHHQIHCTYICMYGRMLKKFAHILHWLTSYHVITKLHFTKKMQSHEQVTDMAARK